MPPTKTQERGSSPQTSHIIELLLHVTNVLHPLGLGNPYPSMHFGSILIKLK